MTYIQLRPKLNLEMEHKTNMKMRQEEGFDNMIYSQNFKIKLDRNRT